MLYRLFVISFYLDYLLPQPQKEHPTRKWTTGGRFIQSHLDTQLPYAFENKTASQPVSNIPRFLQASQNEPQYQGMKGAAGADALICKDLFCNCIMNGA